MIDSKLRWKRTRILSHNKLWNMVVGARNLGKSYQFKDMAIRQYIKKELTTKWVMRYESDLKSVCIKQDFLANLYDKYAHYDLKYDIGGCYIKPREKADVSENWEMFIEFLNLSKRAVKGGEDPTCGLIVYDEFIPIPGVPYLPEEVEKFLEYYYSIARERPVRCVFIANNITRSSPYFSYFKIKLPEPGKIDVSHPEIAVENCKNDEFAMAMHNTRFGKLVSGTKYARYAIDNESLVDLDTFIADRPSKSRCMVYLVSSIGDLFLWLATPAALWISEKGDKNCPKWSVDAKAHNIDTELINHAGSLGKHLIQHYYRQGLLFFDSQDAKSKFLLACYDLIK